MTESSIYSPCPCKYVRRPSVEVRIGTVCVGGKHPIAIQSMASVSTMDTNACIEQAQRIIDAGASIVRYTAQGVKEANNLGYIRAGLNKGGYTQPLVADIHFNPKAADAALEQVEKVRINPVIMSIPKDIRENGPMRTSIIYIGWLKNVSVLLWSVPRLWNVPSG